MISYILQSPGPQFWPKLDNCSSNYNLLSFCYNFSFVSLIISWEIFLGIFIRLSHIYLAPILAMPTKMMMVVYLCKMLAGLTGKDSSMPNLHLKCGPPPFPYIPEYIIMLKLFSEFYNLKLSLSI